MSERERNSERSRPSKFENEIGRDSKFDISHESKRRSRSRSRSRDRGDKSRNERKTATSSSSRRSDSRNRASRFESSRDLETSKPRESFSASLPPSHRQVWGNIALEEEEEERKRNEMKSKTEEPVEVAKANFGLSGALAEDAVTGNMINGVVLKFVEPLDACLPSLRWRLYVFKGEELVETLHISKQSSYLLGKDSRVAHVVLQHPSCSKQHAVIQFRKVDSTDPSTGRTTKISKPYLMDLQSTHKTYLNGIVIDDSRYYELKEKDCMKFGGSTREYVLLHENSSTEPK